jgi:short-subunit dehydrogenase
MELRGSHVLVTGASRGIGAAMARHFARAGARVSVAARTTSAVEAVAREVGGTAFTVDLGDADQVDALIPRVEADAGPVDVLVNNAGLENLNWFHEEDVARIRAVIRLNFEAPVVLARAVLPGMLARGKGHLVWTSSIAGSASFPALSVYAGTKAALNNTAATIRLELRDTPIHTTIVAPGPVDTAMWDNLEDADTTTAMLRRLRLLQLIPKKSPELIARRTVAAVTANRRHVRTPRRLSSQFWLAEAPRRINELVLAKVPLGPGRTGRGEG